MDLKGLVASILRHKTLFAGTTATIFLLGMVTIMLLPNVYTSTAKILVERPNTYNVAGTPSINDTLSQRMHAIIASVTSSANIQKIIQHHKLFEDATNQEDIYAAVEEFRDHTQIEFDNVAVINQYTGKSGMFSMGLLVEYRHTDPDQAYSIANQLTSDILSANENKGQESAAFRRTFLTEQAEQLAQELTTIEKKVASFKNENALYLPEVHPIAIRRLDELENKIERSSENISRLRREAANTAADIATSGQDALLYDAQGQRILGAGEQLRLLEIEYATVSTKYSKDHPTVIRLAKEISGMKQHVSGHDTAGMEVELRKTRQQLTTAKKRYSTVHPDIKALQRKVTDLEASLKIARTTNKPSSTSAPTSPAYNRLLIRKQSLRDDLSMENQKLTALNEDVQSVRSQLERMPLIEQQMASLEREQLNAQNSYQEVQTDLSKTRLGSEMLNANLLDKFILIEPPIRASSPTSPKKNLLAPVLFILALACGLLAVILKYMLQDRIWHSRDIEAILDAPVLLIPRFQ